MRRRSPRIRSTGAILSVVVLSVAVSLLVLLLWTAPGPPARAQTSGTGWRIVGWNNLGMHCDDADFSVFSILPPYNTVAANVVNSSGQLVTSPTGLTVTYQAVADPTGSINTPSAGKTNFWDHVLDLFGVSLPVDVGLPVPGPNSFSMPGAANTPQAMTFEPAHNWFVAYGIPIVPYDDGKVKNTYPMMRLSVKDSTGAVLATTDVVLPVSDEMDCRACHASGSRPDAMPAAGWVYDPDPQRDFRLNVLRIHDDRQLSNPTLTAALATAGYSSAGLYATAATSGHAILCAKCHLSEALPGTGITGIPPLTASMHSLHANVIDPTSGVTLNSSSNRSACYRCHPGSTTRCLRGVMGNSVAPDGTMDIQCQNCHGSMSAVGASTRTGWLEEPNCQACHTGTAVTNSGQIRYTSALTSPGALRTPADTTFATNPDTPAAGFSLYRFSTGHGGLQCESCHGSTHAEFPSSHANDNVQSTELQGHVGMLIECATCHSPVPSTVSGGPHGMHPVGQAWVGAHPNAVESGGSSQCRNCHGTDYRGTVLSRVAATRTLTAFGTKNVWRGFQIGCYTCHSGPSNDSGNPNSPAVVSNLSASTGAGVSVPITLVATDPNNDPLTLRIVDQPANGTVGLAGTTATYFPFPGFSGTDGFTYAAWDGSTDSNLGTVTVTVGSGTCTLACAASAPATAVQNATVQFTGSSTPSNCAGSVSYLWDFGDGSLTSTFASPTHAYVLPGTYTWTLTTSIAGVTCTRTGTITVSAPSSCTLACGATAPATAVQGTSVQFTGSATPSSCTGSVSYVWNFGDGSAASTAQNPVHTYASTGTFHWTLTTSIAGVTCTQSGDITITGTSGCTIACAASVPTSGTRGTAITFSSSATATGCSSDLSYRWSFGDGTSARGRTVTHTYSSSGTYTWRLTVRSGEVATCSRSGTITIGRFSGSD